MAVNEQRLFRKEVKICQSTNNCAESKRAVPRMKSPSSIRRRVENEVLRSRHSESACPKRVLPVILRSSGKPFKVANTASRGISLLGYVGFVYKHAKFTYFRVILEAKNCLFYAKEQIF